MEDFSGFINEEIFLIDQDQKSPEKETKSSAEKPSKKGPASDLSGDYKVGIVAPNLSQEDSNLLYKILGAISILPKEAYVTDSVRNEIGTWIVFDGSLDSIREGLEYFTINDLDGTTIITSKTLAQLRESVEDKGKLWGLLKEHFKA